MKRLSFFLFLFFLWMTVRAQMLRSSGLVLYGGKNTVNYQVASPEKGLPPFDLANSRLGADFTLGAGYRWRLNRPDTGWFFDLSLSARYGRYGYGFRYLSSDVHTTYVGGEGIRNLWSASFAGSVGRYLFRGLNLSVGVEPTFYFYDKSFFDLPIFARLAYDFRFMEVAVQYKWGMTRKFTLSVLLRQYRSTSLAVLQYFHGSTAVLPKEDYSAFNTTSVPFKRGEVSFTRISPFSPVVWI